MKFRNKKMIALALTGTIIAGSLSLSAAQLTKNVQLRYNNIKVQVDSNYKQPKLEPFFIDSSVYVSLRDAGELMGAKVDWDGTNQTVKIDTSTIQGISPEELQKLKQDVANKNVALSAANSKIAKLEAELAKYKGDDKEEDKNDKEEDKETDRTQEYIKETLAFIKDKYQDEHDIKWYFTLKGTESKLELSVEYDSDRDSDDFKALNLSKRESFVEDILEDIQKEFPKSVIKGKLYDRRKKVTIDTFEMDKYGDLTYDQKEDNEAFTSEQLKTFEERLATKYRKFPVLNYSGRYDGSSVQITKFELKENSDGIYYDIYITFSNFAKDAWKYMDSNDRDKLESYLDDIQTDIEREFDVDAEARIYNFEKELISTYDTKLRFK